MGAIHDAAKAFFEEDEWPITELEDGTLRTGFSGQNGKWQCFGRCRDEHDQFAFYSICPINAPDERRAATAEFVTRANYGMIIGNFEFDYSDGEIRYKTSIDVEGSELNAPLIKQMVYANVFMMDRYLPGIIKVVFGDGDPQEALREIEDPQEALRETED